MSIIWSAALRTRFLYRYGLGALGYGVPGVFPIRDERFFVYGPYSPVVGAWRVAARGAWRDFWSREGRV